MSTETRISKDKCRRGWRRRRRCASGASTRTRTIFASRTRSRDAAERGRDHAARRSGSRAERRATRSPAGSCRSTRWARRASCSCAAIGGEMVQLYVKADNAERVRGRQELRRSATSSARGGPLFKTRKGKRALKVRRAAPPDQDDPPAAGQGAAGGHGRHRRRAALSAALPRLHRPSREGRGVPQARADRRRRFAGSSTSAGMSSARRACSCRPTAARRRGRSRPTTTRSRSICSCASPPSSISSGWSSVASIASTRSAASSATRGWTASTTPSSPSIEFYRRTRPTKT